MGPMEGSIVLRPADGPLEMALGCIGVEPTAAVGPLQGGWWLTFGADADRPWGAAVADVAATDRITALRIVGLAPAALRGVVVRHGETLLFEMESHVGTTGHVSTAGEILHAMGLYRAGCGEGLMVDLLPAVDACTWRALPCLGRMNWPRSPRNLLMKRSRKGLSMVRATVKVGKPKTPAK